MSLRSPQKSPANANWKILIEGGIEAYHFKVTHRYTIGPHFKNNLSSYQRFGMHMRSVLARESLTQMGTENREAWDIRQHTNVLYTVFPMNQFLLMQDHFAWIQARPISADQTHVRIMTMVPADALIDANKEHWAKNQQITCSTLREDFDMGEGIQAGLMSGANETLTFGRFEGALATFNAQVDALLAG